MPKATLTYTLPEDEYEYKMAVNGHKYRQALQELYEEWRKHEKWDAPAPTRESFNEILDDNNIRLFDDD